MGNPNSPTLTMCKNFVPSFTKVGNLIPPLLQGVETSSAKICKVWKLNSPHLQGVDTLFPHIYKVWKPYPPTFTECGNLIHNTHFKVCLISQDDISIYAQYVPLRTQPNMLLYCLPSALSMIFNLPHLDPQT